MSNAINLGAGGSGGSSVTTIAGDTGTITGSSVTIYAHNSTQNSGSSVKFTNSGTTSTLNVSDSHSNTIIGNQSGNSSISGSYNTGLGFNCLAGVSSGQHNVSVGTFSSQQVSTNSDNVGIGYGALRYIDGQANIGIGSNTIGNFLATGSYNIAIGNNAGSSLSGSSNIVINNAGSNESNTIRIGTQGTGSGQQNKAFIAGIAGTTTSNSQMVTVDSTTGQLGAATIPSGATSFIDQGTGITLAANTGYFVTAATTQILPASPSQGDLIIIVCDTSGAVVVTANTGQTIRLGSSISSSAGTLTSTAIGDSLTLRYRASGTKWIATASVGTWTIA